MAPRGMPRPPVFTRQAPPALCASLRIRRGTCLPQTRDKPRGVPARCPASPLMPMNAPRGMPLRNVPAPADVPEPPPDRTRAACPFALQRPSLILSQSHVYAACPEQWPRACPSPPGPSARTPPVPREPRSKKAPWEPADRVQRRKHHQKPRAERARGLSLARHPRSHQRTTLRAAKETGISRAQAHPPKGKCSRPSPPGPSAQTSPRPPRNARQKRPRKEPTDRLRRRKPHQKPRAERARGLSLGPPSPQPSTNDSSRRKRNGHPPKRRRILPKASAPVLPHRGPPRKRLPSPAKRAAKAPPEGTSRPPPTPAQRFPSLRPVFPGTPPRMGMRPGKSGAFRHQTRQLARRTLLSRAESAQPGALGMPTNTKIALIYKNQVRFCFPGWRTFSTPGAPLTALPRAPRCRVRG